MRTILLNLFLTLLTFLIFCFIFVCLAKFNSLWISNKKRNEIEKEKCYKMIENKQKKSHKKMRGVWMLETAFLRMFWLYIWVHAWPCSLSHSCRCKGCCSANTCKHSSKSFQWIMKSPLSTRLLLSTVGTRSSSSSMTPCVRQRSACSQKHSGVHTSSLTALLSLQSNCCSHSLTAWCCPKFPSKMP